MNTVHMKPVQLLSSFDEESSPSSPQIDLGSNRDDSEKALDTGDANVFGFKRLT